MRRPAGGRHRSLPDSATRRRRPAIPRPPRRRIGGRRFHGRRRRGRPGAPAHHGSAGSPTLLVSTRSGAGRIAGCSVGPGNGSGGHSGQPGALDVDDDDDAAILVDPLRSAHTGPGPGTRTTRGRAGSRDLPSRGGPGALIAPHDKDRHRRLAGRLAPSPAVGLLGRRRSAQPRPVRGSRGRRPRTVLTGRGRPDGSGVRDHLPPALRPSERHHGAMLRLRQIALVAHELDPVVTELSAELGVEVAFNDPGVDVFGLQNAVMPIGNQFLEVVAPIKEGTAAGRYLDRRKGDGGYMVILQCDEHAARKARLGRRARRALRHGPRHQRLQDPPAAPGRHRRFVPRGRPADRRRGHRDRPVGARRPELAARPSHRSRSVGSRRRSSRATIRRGSPHAGPRCSRWRSRANPSR